MNPWLWLAERLGRAHREDAAQDAEAARRALAESRRQRHQVDTLAAELEALNSVRWTHQHPGKGAT